MKQFATLLLAAVVALALVTAAFAHNRTVETPNGQVKGGWVGAQALPGQGQGLIVGGPTGEWLISPAHAKGLNTACYALEANPSVVDIRGPGPNCPHGE